MQLPSFAIPDSQNEFFEEIAGILEHDARMGRREAEFTALRIVYAMMNESQRQNISTIDDK